jgi:hypothetical protein
MGKRRHPRVAAPVAPVAKESPAAEWATIGWLLAALTTAGCLALWGLVRVAAYFGQSEGVQSGGQTLARVAGFLLFAALVTGTANLLLAAAAHGLRSEAPPRPLRWFSLAVGVLPMMLLWLA